MIEQLRGAFEGELGELALLSTEPALQIQRFAQERCEIERAPLFPRFVALCLAIDRTFEVDHQEFEGRRANDEIVQLGVAMRQASRLQCQVLTQRFFA